MYSAPVWTVYNVLIINNVLHKKWVDWAYRDCLHSPVIASQCRPTLRTQLPSCVNFCPHFCYLPWTRQSANLKCANITETNHGVTSHGLMATVWCPHLGHLAVHCGSNGSEKKMRYFMVYFEQFQSWILILWSCDKCMHIVQDTGCKATGIAYKPREVWSLGDHFDGFFLGSGLNCKNTREITFT